MTMTMVSKSGIWSDTMVLDPKDVQAAWSNHIKLVVDDDSCPLIIDEARDGDGEHFEESDQDNGSSDNDIGNLDDLLEEEA